MSISPESRRWWWGAVCFVVLPQARGKGRACVSPISRLGGKGRDAPSTRTLCSRGPPPSALRPPPQDKDIHTPFRALEKREKRRCGAQRVRARVRASALSAQCIPVYPPSSSPAAHHRGAPPRTRAKENSRSITPPHRSRHHALHSRPVRRYRLRMSCVTPQHHIRIRTHPRRTKRRRPGRTMERAVLSEDDGTESHHRHVVVTRGGGGT